MVSVSFYTKIQDARATLLSKLFKNTLPGVL